MKEQDLDKNQIALSQHKEESATGLNAEKSADLSASIKALFPDEAGHDKTRQDSEISANVDKPGKKKASFDITKILTSLKNSLPTKGLSAEHLVFTYDGYELYGALVHFRQGKAELSAAAISDKMNMQKAIEDILDQFRADKVKNLPKKALLASAEVVYGRVDIPVSSAKPKPKAQMHELVRWELESYISEIGSMWSLGALLQGYGLINSEQRQNTSVELELSRDQGAKMIRFGEMAIQLGYITREQLNEMMALQERLMSIDGRMDCAWQAQNDGETDAEGTDVWLGAGVFRHSRRQWLDAFARNGIKLETIQPLHGLGALFIDQSSESDYEQILVEIFKERVVVMRFMGKAVVSVAHHRVDHVDDLFNTVVAGVSELMRPETESVWLSSVHADITELVESLSLNLGTTIKVVQHEAQADLPNLSVPPALVYQFFALAEIDKGIKTRSILSIDAPDPKPPIYKNPDFWRYLAPVLLLIAIAINESYMQYSLQATNQRLADIEAEKVEKERLAKQIQAVIAQTAKEQEKLDELVLEVNSLEKTLGQLNQLVKRNPLMLDLMLSLQQSINDNVIIDRFIESELSSRMQERGFEIQGWALNDNAAQLFSRELDRRVDKLGYEVQRVKINRSIGRSGVRGYGLNLWLIEKNLEFKQAKQRGDGSRKL